SLVESWKKYVAGGFLLDIEKATPTKVKPWMRKCVRILIGAISLFASALLLIYAMCVYVRG
ncbi:MAG: hypothetical protein KAT35_02280, partial [Candidatus Aenigmarchaeota archaeon]|nr:hypothetical protein [Candidatus Aenigmarchaeota archaeon]